MTREKRVIFVQGYGDYSDGVWPGWLEKELIKSGFLFNYLKMPNVMYPEVGEWLSFIEAEKIIINSDTHFVGHSLGCITIARFLERLSKKKVAGGCIFVAGFCCLPPEVPLLSNFCSPPLDFSKVKEHAKEFVMIISTNDSLIPPADSEYFANKLGARIIRESNKGHFKSDVIKLPSVLNSILEIDKMKEELKEIKRLKKLDKQVK